MWTSSPLPLLLEVEGRGSKSTYLPGILLASSIPPFPPHPPPLPAPPSSPSSSLLPLAPPTPPYCPSYPRTHAPELGLAPSKTMQSAPLLATSSALAGGVQGLQQIADHRHHHSEPPPTDQGLCAVDIGCFQFWRLERQGQGDLEDGY